MLSIRSRSHLASKTDPGFGIIEVVVSMFLLGLLAAAFLPLLVQGLQKSATNATLVTATQLANDQIELARSATKCTELTSSTTTSVDPRNVSLLVVRTVGTSCSPVAENPVNVPVDVTVTRTDTGDVLATAHTFVFIAEP
ncbi:hypothetical protein GCM10027052_00050 [Parafrigoribacterium mesophilum]|uniref:hypothetical protein n=1 Tax=Parafrigoribacterium mesophilum TaxID=433646 RepID=UPI0031FD2DB1